MHQLPSRGEERPSYKESKKGGHNYLHHVKELTGERAPPVIGTVRSHRLRTVIRVARCNAVHRIATHAAHCYPRTRCRRPQPWTARAPSRRSLASCPFNGVPCCVQPQVSSPSVSIELHTIGGFCCVSPDMPPPAEVQVHWPLFSNHHHVHRSHRPSRHTPHRYTDCVPRRQRAAHGLQPPCRRVQRLQRLLRHRAALPCKSSAPRTRASAQPIASIYLQPTEAIHPQRLERRVAVRASRPRLT